MNPLTPDGHSALREYDDAARLEEFHKLRLRGALTTAMTENFSMEAAAAFLETFDNRGEYLSDAITLLAEVSTLEEPNLAEPGSHATFPLLVEQMSDSFDPRHCGLDDRAFAQMISICRKLPSAAKLDALLRRFGIENEGDLVARKACLRNRSPMHDAKEREKVCKVLALSRVTLGADVAITSVVLQKAKRSFPNAELVLLGSPKLAQLFGETPSSAFEKFNTRTTAGCSTVSTTGFRWSRRWGRRRKTFVPRSTS